MRLFKINVKRAILIILGIYFISLNATGYNSFNDNKIKFIYCSDLHYGIKRTFRGATADAADVVKEMIKSFDILANTSLPEDSGVGGGEVFGNPDFIVCTGDISNRMQDGAWTATKSWNQFLSDMVYGFSKSHDSCPIYLVPGNHDISNAIGHPKKLFPERDDASAVGIYNLNMPTFSNSKIDTLNNMNYNNSKVHYSFVKNNLRFAFIGIWPDIKMRQWLDSVLVADPATSTIIFTHDPVQADTKHFTNPNYPYDINNKDKFENLIADTCCALTVKDIPTANWHKLEEFFKSHPQIKAYFHGDSNYNEFYNWKGTSGSISLPIFRVDSPIKGKYSSKDEKLLSYQVVCIDTGKRAITVRECFWNLDLTTKIDWGDSKTIYY